MERTPVASSNIRAIAYDQESQTLEVEFHSGGTYRYLGVPQSEYDALMLADSKGRYLNMYIKGRYPYEKV